MASHSKQLTLRDLDPRVLAEIHRVAKTEGLSVNKAAAKILKLGAGIQEAPASRNIGQAVDRFVGSLSRAEAEKLSSSQRSLQQVDDELWK
jgi:hypothetical protein